MNSGGQFINRVGGLPMAGSANDLITHQVLDGGYLYYQKTTAPGAYQVLVGGYVYNQAKGSTNLSNHQVAVGGYLYYQKTGSAGSGQYSNNNYIYADSAFTTPVANPSNPVIDLTSPVANKNNPVLTTDLYKNISTVSALINTSTPVNLYADLKTEMYKVGNFATSLDGAITYGLSLINKKTNPTGINQGLLTLSASIGTTPSVDLVSDLTTEIGKIDNTASVLDTAIGNVSTTLASYAGNTIQEKVKTVLGALSSANKPILGLTTTSLTGATAQPIVDSINVSLNNSTSTDATTTITNILGQLNSVTTPSSIKAGLDAINTSLGVYQGVDIQTGVNNVVAAVATPSSISIAGLTSTPLTSSTTIQSTIAAINTSLDNSTTTDATTTITNILGQLNSVTTPSSIKAGLTTEISKISTDTVLNTAINNVSGQIGNIKTGTPGANETRLGTYLYGQAQGATNTSAHQVADADGYLYNQAKGFTDTDTHQVADADGYLYNQATSATDTSFTYTDISGYDSLKYMKGSHAVINVLADISDYLYLQKTQWDGVGVNEVLNHTNHYVYAQAQGATNTSAHQVADADGYLYNQETSWTGPNQAVIGKYFYNQAKGSGSVSDGTYNLDSDIGGYLYSDFSCTNPIANMTSPVANMISPIADMAKPIINTSNPIANMTSPIASTTPVADLTNPVVDTNNTNICDKVSIFLSNFDTSQPTSRANGSDYVLIPLTSNPTNLQSLLSGATYYSNSDTGYWIPDIHGNPINLTATS